MTNIRAGSLAAAILFGLGLVCTTAGGQGPPKKADPEITVELLREWLDQLGYEFQEMKSIDPKDKKEIVMGFWAATDSRSGGSGKWSWKRHIGVSLSIDKKWVWLIDYVTEGIKNIPPANLPKMLAANSRMGAVRFEFLEAENWARLAACYPVKGFNRILLKSQIEAVATASARTDMLWYSKAWAEGEKKEEKKAASPSAARPGTDKADPSGVPAGLGRLQPRTIPVAALAPAEGGTIAARLAVPASVPGPAAQGRPVAPEYDPFTPAQRPERLTVPSLPRLPSPPVTDPGVQAPANPPRIQPRN